MRKKIIIVGDGIAAWALIDKLILSGRDYELVNISADEYFPPCSLNSTAINCLRGVKKEISALGGLLVSSHCAFEDFYLENNPEGVSKGQEHQIWKGESQWANRYKDYQSLSQNSFLSESVKNMDYFYTNEAYFINTQKLKEWFKKRQVNVSYKREIVSSVKGQKVYTNLDCYEFDQLFLCASNGVTGIELNDSKEHKNYLSYSKPVAGSYLEIQNSLIDSASSFNLALDKYHLIYRKDQNIIQIGSSSVNCDFHLPNKKALKKIYEHVSSHVKLELPAFDAFKQKTGVRQKGRKRTPFWGEVSKDVYVISGLYKNGFSFAFKASADLENIFK